jgi:hypothetical protein
MECHYCIKFAAVLTAAKAQVGAIARHGVHGSSSCKGNNISGVGHSTPANVTTKLKIMFNNAAIIFDMMQLWT